MRNREIIARQFRILLELNRHPLGLGAETLAKRIGVSRATVNRDLELLRRRVGLPIERVRRTGEVWHRLREMPVASVAATPLQAAALRLAREALAPLRGTALVDQLDSLMALLPDAVVEVRGLDVVGKSQRTAASIVAAIDLGMQERRRIEIVVRVAAHGGEERRYVLDPLLLRVVDDELYLFAWSHERRDTRTFKVARIRKATVRDEAAGDHPEVDRERAFAGAVKAWSGALQPVRVRIRPSVAWLAEEYPLVASQEVVREGDGSAVVHAEVAGLVESVRWVLSWGSNATVLDPPTLRAAVTRELRGALAGYEGEDGQVRSWKVSEVEASKTSATPGSDVGSARREGDGR